MAGKNDIQRLLCFGLDLDYRSEHRQLKRSDVAARRSSVKCSSVKCSSVKHLLERSSCLQGVGPVSTTPVRARTIGSLVAGTRATGTRVTGSSITGTLSEGAGMKVLTRPALSSIATA